MKNVESAVHVFIFHFIYRKAEVAFPAYADVLTLFVRRLSCTSGDVASPGNLLSFRHSPQTTLSSVFVIMSFVMITHINFSVVWNKQTNKLTNMLRNSGCCKFSENPQRRMSVKYFAPFQGNGSRHYVKSRELYAGLVGQCVTFTFAQTVCYASRLLR